MDHLIHKVDEICENAEAERIVNRMRRRFKHLRVMTAEEFHAAAPLHKPCHQSDQPVVILFQARSARHLHPDTAAASDRISGEQVILFRLQDNDAARRMARSLTDGKFCAAKRNDRIRTDIMNLFPRF